LQATLSRRILSGFMQQKSVHDRIATVCIASMVQAHAYGSAAIPACRQLPADMPRALRIRS
jgi:hypothetical protein